MFGVNAVEMTKALIKPRIKVGSEYVHKGQNAGQVRLSCDVIYCVTFVLDLNSLQSF